MRAIIIKCVPCPHLVGKEVDATYMETMLLPTGLTAIYRTEPVHYILRGEALREIWWREQDLMFLPDLNEEPQQTTTQTPKENHEHKDNALHV